MNSHDQWQNSFFERAEFPAGQSLLNLGYIDEPNTFGSEAYGYDGGTYVLSDTGYLGQSSTDSYEEPLPSTIQFAGSTHQHHTSPIFDSYERSVDMITPRWSRSPYPRDLKESELKLSVWPTDTGYSVDNDHQGHVCQQCNQLFKNLQELDHHAKKTPHRAWKCAEPSCGKMYARRDTFLRHRATHKDKGHPCSICSRPDKQKIFKRKDHLKEHIRNCHSKGTDPKSVDGARSNGGNVNTFSADSGGEYGIAGVAVKSEGGKQLVAIDNLVKSLHIVMGNDEKGMLGELEYSLTTLSGPEMKTVVSSMARAALETTRETSDKRLKSPYAQTRL